MKVSRAQVEGLDTFLGQRERTFSRVRSQLTAFFYGRAFERLRDHRLRQIQQALRKAGISFHPAVWPTADTRIQLWRDGSFVERNGEDPVLAGLLPQWLEPFVLPSGSRDPLGLQAPAERLVNEVLPGLTVFTFRAGYYGFLTWAIRKVNGLPRDAVPRRTPRREILNALERALERRASRLPPFGARASALTVSTSWTLRQCSPRSRGAAPGLPARPPLLWLGKPRQIRCLWERSSDKVDHARCLPPDDQQPQTSSRSGKLMVPVPTRDSAAGHWPRLAVGMFRAFSAEIMKAAGC